MHRHKRRKGILLMATQPVAATATASVTRVLKPESRDTHTEKADVYSCFVMICFEQLMGKVPFEDNHLQGDKTSKNIHAGRAAAVPVPGAQVPGRPDDEAVLARRPSATPAVHLHLPRPSVPEAVPRQQQGQADAPPAAPAADYLDTSRCSC
jgi:hypothetical protein